MSSWGALLRRGHLGTEADRATHRTLHTALLASPPLRMGLSAAAAEKSLKHLRALLGAPAVAMTDTSGLLAWDGVPTILYSLFWKRFNTRGALWSIYGGLVSAITLIIFSPVVSGKAADAVTKKSPSMLQGVDFHWFPLDNPGIISIPLGFVLGYLGTVTSKEYNAAKYAEMEVRSLTGHGAETATHH